MNLVRFCCFWKLWVLGRFEGQNGRFGDLSQKVVQNRDFGCFVVIQMGTTGWGVSVMCTKVCNLCILVF